MSDLYPILYLSVAIVALYQGQFLLRKAGPAQRTYAWMLVVDGVLGATAYAAGGEAGYEALAELAGSVAIFGALGLLVAPPLLRALTRWALSTELFGLAVVLTQLREILTPGLGARQEREVIEVLRAIQAGATDAVMAELRNRHAATADRRTRQVLEDRMLMLLLQARRWREAGALFEARTDDAVRPAQVPLLVELLRAYGELGELDRAARLLAFLDELPTHGSPALAFLIGRARIMFLVFSGRADAVAKLLDGRTGPVRLPPDARAYWLGTAQLFARDGAAARTALTEAVRRAGDRSRRDAAKERLAQVDQASARQLTDEQAALADAVAARALAVAADSANEYAGLRPGGHPMTRLLVLVNIVVYGLVVWLIGTSSEPWALARAGGSLREAIDAGEWWRLIAAPFLHGHLIHLGLNMLSLWRLGQLVEQIVGSLRFTAIYALSAIGGACASYGYGKAGLSVGASGAVFGVLGAAIVELALRTRRERQSSWRRALLGNLVFVAIANLVVLGTVSIIDQAAHVGGLAAGALAGLLFSSETRLGRIRAARTLAALICAMGLAAMGVAAWRVGVTSYARTIARIGWSYRPLLHAKAKIALELPRSWIMTEAGLPTEPLWLLAPSLTIEPVDAASGVAVAAELAAKLGEDPAVTEVASAAPSFAPPNGWSVAERRFVFVGADSSYPFRHATFIGPAAVITFIVPERAASEAAPVVERIVESVRIRR